MELGLLLVRIRVWLDPRNSRVLVVFLNYAILDIISLSFALKATGANIVTKMKLSPGVVLLAK